MLSPIVDDRRANSNLLLRPQVNNSKLSQHLNNNSPLSNMRISPSRRLAALGQVPSINGGSYLPVPAIPSGGLSTRNDNLQTMELSGAKLAPKEHRL